MTKPHHDSNLDILRSIAVLSVFFAHLLRFAPHFDVSAHGAQQVSLGMAGVLIFFVHTSLVLMQSLERTGKELADWPLAKYFYIRRAFRIYPLSVCVILISIALSIPSNPLVQYRSYRLGWALSNLLLIQNITLAKNVSDPMWSLPYELQMYLVLPILFLGLRASAGHLRLLVVYGGGVLVSMIHWVFQFVPCFLSGVIAYDLLKTVQPRFRAWLWTPTVLAIVAIFTITPDSNAKWKWGSTCMFVGLSLPMFHQNTGAIATAAARIAKYSYGIYLCHLPLMWLFDCKLTLPDLQRPVFVVIATGIASGACFHAIEHPLIRVGTRIAAWKPAKPKSLSASPF